jgi:hypothetical protein
VFARRGSVDADGAFQIKDVTEGAYEPSWAGGSLALRAGDTDARSLT